MVRPRREPQWGWPPKGRAMGFVKVLKPWTRRGTDSFLGQNYCQGQEIVSLTGKLHRLEPDG